MNDIDLNYRPDTYFRPHPLGHDLLSKVKGAVLKGRLRELLAAGRHAEVETLLGSEGISEQDRKALEAVHPMFMGGNYLPDTENGEVEIARICIKSTTYDVTSVFATQNGNTIHYRVVDEYDGDTLTGAAELESSEPLTLRELADFFLNAWPLIGVLEMNFQDDLDSAMAFFAAESDFDPAFDRLCRDRVIAHFRASKKVEDADEVD